MKKLNQLKNKYEEIEIPVELENIVNTSIQQAKKNRQKKSVFKYGVMSAVATFSLFIGSINMSPAMAQSMANIPVLGSIVEVFTVQKLTIQEDNYQANLNTPAIQGLEDENLQNALNEKYIEENKALFEDFKQEMEDMKKAGDGHLSVNTIYEVKTDTEQLFSIARYETQTMASTSTTLKYDTIDKQRNILLTLPSLFKGNQYIETISTYIAEEMKRQMALDQTTSYFLDADFTDDFKQIKPDQDFYITANHKLVISFDKYEVAPGSMGVVKFEIPSEILADLLVSDTYIR